MRGALAGLRSRRRRETEPAGQDGKGLAGAGGAAPAAPARRGGHVASPRLPALDSARSGALSQALARPSASTSTQMAGLAMAEVAPPTGAHGILLGLDVVTGSPVVHDPFVAYAEEPGFSSPNVVTFGDLGFGKSQLSKAWVLRNMMLGRRVIVVDKKRQDRTDGQASEGEYSSMARRLGFQPVTLRPGGGGVRINVLDSRIAGETSMGVAGQQMLLESVISAAMGRGLTEVERLAVRVARRTAVLRGEAAGDVAHVGHVVDALLDPDEDVAARTPGVGSADTLRGFGRDCGFALDRLVSEELAGLIDGPTDPRLDLEGQLVTFDISSLPEEGPAVPIMMSVIGTWVRAVLAASARPVPTLLVIDEAWHVVDGQFAEVARRNAKVARGIALSNYTIFQHPSDIPAGSPAVAMIKEAQTVVVFRQEKADDAVEVCRLLGWDEEEAQRVLRLEQGVAMVKIGSAPPVVCSMIMSSFELEVGDTNQAMTSVATLSSPRAPTGEVEDHAATTTAPQGQAGDR
ncbi:ATP/GTP-binding protein [Actinomyces lilanjuaniae]|nr:ATP/GTP-binding protein [Actinomyces lilanjuaniae]